MNGFTDWRYGPHGVELDGDFFLRAPLHRSGLAGLVRDEIPTFDGIL